MKRSLRELRIPKEIEEALEDLVERLKESLGEFKLYLFGSYARGDWVRGISDVDIVVVSPKFRGVHPVERAAMVRKLSSSLPGLPLASSRHLF